MSIFDDDGPIFNDTNFGAESIIVMPDGTEASARTVVATVVRKPPALEPQQRKQLRKVIQFRVNNNATTGMALSELQLGRSKVRLAPDRRGGALSDLLIEMPDDGQPWHDGGMLRLIAK